MCCIPYCDSRQDSSKPVGPAPTMTTGTHGSEESLEANWRHDKARTALVAESARLNVISIVAERTIPGVRVQCQLIRCINKYVDTHECCS